ncbi:LytTR family DNA-binding domain-containing protein [Jiulongibacter sediminis]|nr:LytTR family DNA-binding domain-containing protein [Jiulongibacter sediminis]
MKTPKVLQQIAGIAKILFIEADQNYSVFHLSNGRRLVSGYTLKFHVQYLDEQQFFRMNRSLLVSWEFVSEVNFLKDNGIAVLKNDRRIRIPRRRLKAFQKEYNGKTN